jgi:hypothetical protein
MPFTKFKSEIILMKKNGLYVIPIYSNDTACAQFIGVIGDTLKKKTAVDVGKLQSSEPPFIHPRLSQPSHKIFVRLYSKQPLGGISQRFQNKTLHLRV